MSENVGSLADRRARGGSGEEEQLFAARVKPNTEFDKAFSTGACI